MKIYMVNREGISECDGQQSFTNECLGMYTNRDAAEMHFYCLYRQLTHDPDAEDVVIQSGSFGRNGNEIYYEDKKAWFGGRTRIYITESDALDMYEGA